MMIHRRRFLQGATAFAAALTLPSRVQSVEPFGRKGEGRLLLSLAAYSFRDFMKDANHPQNNTGDAARDMDMFSFVDYCAEHGCVGAELTSYYFPPDINTDYLLKLRRHCFLRGVEVSGTSVGNTFTHPPGRQREEQIQYVKKWIDYAAAMGAPHIRVFAGGSDKQSKEEAVKNCISSLQECADYAGKHGIFLGIENHGGIVAEPSALLEIIHAVQSKWVGINLDSANFHTDDPYADFARCAEFAVNVQIKTEVHPRNQATQPADFKRYTKILREAHYQGYVALEYEAAEDPRTAVPRALSELKALMS
jgi:sugar phosphate isomerase/epimerase